MRRWLALSAMLLTAGCGGDEEPAGYTKMTLRNPVWERVDVEIVITKSIDCNDRGPGFISDRAVVMKKDAVEPVDVPDGDFLCWRHDRNPKAPIRGDWSGWSRASLYPGQPSKTDL
jgi:hypothetical protein